MKAAAHIVRAMIPPSVQAPREADRIGRLAAATNQGFAWTMTWLLRSLHRLDARLSRHPRKQVRT